MIFFSYLEFSLFIYMFFAAVIKHLINFKSIFRLNDVWVLILLLPISFSYTSGGNWSFLLFLLFLIVITDFETPLDFFIYLFKIITALSFSLVSVVVGLLLYWGLNLSILYKFPPFYSHKIAVLIFLTCFLAGVLFAKNKPAVFLTEYLSKLKMHKKYFYSILGVQLTLIACLFILALTAYYFNSAIEIIVVFSVLLLLFFTVTILVMFFSFKTVEQENHLKTKKKELDSFLAYSKTIENNYKETMTFKHDLKNILLSLGELQQDQLSRHVKGHIQAIISEANQAVFKRTPALEVLDQISDETVRNFLKCKAIMAYTDSHILTIFQVASPVDSFFTDNLSLIRMLGILIDNAVEACQKNDFSEYFITIKSSTTGIEIQVKNPVRENNLSLTKISTYGVSTKGNDRGIGLSSLFSLSEKSTNTRVNLSVAHHFFIATLTIYKGAVNK